jgi:hypothetical protein
MEESMSKKGLIISISITQVLLVLLALVGHSFRDPFDWECALF